MPIKLREMSTIYYPDAVSKENINIKTLYLLRVLEEEEKNL